MIIIERNFIKKDEIIREERKKIYFCPYCYALCIYAENAKLPHYFKYDSAIDTYTCFHCRNEPFNDETYTKRKHRRKPFHDNGKSSDDVVIPLITKAISSLRNKGFSNRDIHVITHFPRALINRIVATHWDKSIFIIPIDEFLKKHLEVPSNSSKKDIVEVALLYGCPYAVIRHLVPMRKIEVTMISKKLCSRSENKTEIAINKAKRKIKIIDDGLEKRVSITTREKK
ncbi:MAG: hypothetical protein EOM50_16775 [Erysipelotrichia bacterium]|nr:hypothetical protein [Erysipelotrichia bacterium]